MFKMLLLILFCFGALGAFDSEPMRHQSKYCEGHDLGDFVASPNDCKLFFWCGENEEAVLAACPPNMFFNAVTKLCDAPENVQCAINATTSTTTSTLRPITTTNRPQSPHNNCVDFRTKQPSSNTLTFISHQANCQLYYMCYHGQTLMQACSPKLHWNSRLNKCDLPSNANCLLSELDEDLKDEDAEVLPSLDEHIWGKNIRCPSHGEHIFPNTKRCDSFIYCVEGQAVLQICPFYQFFDVDSASCKRRSEAVCVNDLNLNYRLRNSP